MLALQCLYGVCIDCSNIYSAVSVVEVHQELDVLIGDYILIR